VFDIKDVQLIATILNRTIIISKYNTKKKYVLLLYESNKVIKKDVPLCVSHLYLESKAFSFIITEPKNTIITYNLVLIHL
jgi:hypothetical protein